MRQIKSFLLLILSIQFLAAQQTVKKDEKYIQTYAELAVKEMELYKIPASITLAQGLLETANGQSVLAQQANNHFGIKCKGDWEGGRIYHDDDAKGECFRKYTSVEESYRDHSLFLANRPYYKKLFTLDLADYKGWAHGLKKAGYATNPRYANILISLIERYKLYEFDKISSSEVVAKLVEMYPDSSITSESSLAFEQEKEDTDQPLADIPDTIHQQKTISLKKGSAYKVSNFEFPNQRIQYHPNGNLKFIVLRDGDTLEQISRVYNIPMEELMDYNDLYFNKTLYKNQKIFLEPKKRSGVIKEYIAKEGDDMYKISQNNAISLVELYKRNSMMPGEEPKVGDKILLKGSKS